MKLTKEFSDALGFKSLSNLTGFVAEYPVEGATIQKIVDDSFTATCFKCYPIIAEAGIDPTTFVPKNQLILRNELRKQFPIKVVPEKDSDEEVVEIEVAKPFPKYRPREVSPKNVKVKEKTPVVFTSVLNYCQNCAILKEAETARNNLIQELNRKLEVELARNKALSRELNNAHSDMKALRAELMTYKNDPEFQSIIQFQRSKRQRKQ